jgi:sortase (surface protein transpeptidase)
MTGRHRWPAPSRLPLPRIGGVVASSAVAVAVAVLLLTPPAPEPAHPVTGPAPPPTWATEPAQAVQAPAARPVRVRIPAIKVDSPIIDIGVDASGALAPPETADRVGWFTEGPAPGAVGPALLAAHVDSRAGPGVFYHLVDLHPGDAVTVDRADGSTASFTVVSIARVAKTAFPTELIYAPLPVPMLRLVTCGGTFDRSVHSYRDNVIVEAVPSEAR